MTVKGFFKSTAFKCIITLLAILLVCGVFLTVANGFLSVSDNERFDRAIKKLYGKDVTVERIEDLSNQKTSFDYSDIIEAYKVKDDGNYLIKAEGKEGFGGTVTCWVVVETGDGENGEKTVTGVMKIAIEKASGESYIGNVTEEALNRLAELAAPGKEIEGGYKHGSREDGDDKIATGASFSMRAISNCVNGAMQFVENYLTGIVPADFYPDNGFKYLDLINKDATSYVNNDGVVTYSITTMGYKQAGAFVLTIEVAETDGVAAVNSVTMVTSGSTAELFNERMYDLSNYNGKNLQYFTDMLGGDMACPERGSGKDISTGATYSNYNIAYACAFALANYQKCLEIPFEGGNA